MSSPLVGDSLILILIIFYTTVLGWIAALQGATYAISSAQCSTERVSSHHQIGDKTELLGLGNPNICFFLYGFKLKMVE